MNTITFNPPLCNCLLDLTEDNTSGDADEEGHRVVVMGLLAASEQANFNKRNMVQERRILLWHEESTGKTKQKNE